MPKFMTEEEAIAVIEKNMDKIEARMASGTNASASISDGSGSGTGSSPCNGSYCDESGVCCNCCLC